MKILFIIAHPHDLIDLAGGTIANHIKAGDQVYTFCCTHGMFSHPPDSAYTIGAYNIDFKLKEVASALDALGVPIGDRYVPDGIGSDGLELHTHKTISLYDYVTIIRKLKPDAIVTHHPTEFNHPDHATIGGWVQEAIVAAGRFAEGVEEEKHVVSNVFFYGFQFRPKMVKLGYNVLPPDVVIDVTDVIDLKAKAFMELKSQYNTETIVWDRLNSMEREQGRIYGFKYAEWFISLNPCRAKLLPDFGDVNFYSLLKEKAEVELETVSVTERVFK